jgi:hypothetical protein
VGERFRLVPIRHLRLADTDPRKAQDLTADVAAAILNATASTVWRWTHEGRRRRDTGLRVWLPAFYPYGRGEYARAYYSLADIEAFAVAAWNVPRVPRYEIIPPWYLRKHGRDDLLDARPATVTVAPQREQAGLADDEAEAVRRGYPRGSYADGADVFSPGGVLLNPGPDDSEAMHTAARDELVELVLNPPI